MNVFTCAKASELTASHYPSQVEKIGKNWGENGELNASVFF
jgi:hypothetical protein